MGAREVALLQARGRIAVGVAMLLAPALSRALDEPPAPVDTPEATLTGHPA